jgi:two-component system chemotaxis response regulator CheY
MSKPILIVDDSSSIRQLLRFTLEKGGHTVEEATRGDDGLAQARTGAYALVITDQNMPGLTGLELVKALRSEKATASLPALVLTTETDGDMKAKAREAGATGWLVKPFQPERLLEVVAKVLG